MLGSVDGCPHHLKVEMAVSLVALQPKALFGWLEKRRASWSEVS